MQNEKKAEVMCLTGGVLGVVLMLADITFGTMLYLNDKLNTLMVIVVIVLFIASFVLIMLKGTCCADDDGVRIDMPIGRNKLIPYSEITAVTIDAAVGSKTSKYSSKRYVILKLVIATDRGNTTLKTGGGTIETRNALNDPAVKAQIIENSSFAELAAYIRQRSGI